MKNDETDVYHDSTQYETQALKAKYNLADGHAHQTSSASQKEIIARFSKIWYEMEITPPYIVEQEFIKAFFEIRKQPAALNRKSLLTFSASISMAIISTYLTKRKMSVGLIQPCYDNIHDLLAHFGVSIRALEEGWLGDPQAVYKNLAKHLSDVDALLIVDPNNPTGHTLFSKKHEVCNELIRFAKDTNKLLIFDFCFSHFVTAESASQVIDGYALLDEAGIEYLTMEDTGKTWSTHELKTSTLTCSSALYEEIYGIYSSYLLNVSPFTLRVLTEYIKNASAEDFKHTRELFAKNRRIAQRKLAGSILEIQDQDTPLSLLWCRITTDITATKLQEMLGAAGIYILSGRYFFWHDPERGEQFIRIALARDTTIFTEAMTCLRTILDSLNEDQFHVLASKDKQMLNTELGV